MPAWQEMQRDLSRLQAGQLAQDGRDLDALALQEGYLPQLGAPQQLQGQEAGGDIDPKQAAHPALSRGRQSYCRQCAAFSGQRTGTIDTAAACSMRMLLRALKGCRGVRSTICKDLRFKSGCQEKACRRRISRLLERLQKSHGEVAALTRPRWPF